MKENEVKDFFNQPDLYLHNRYGIMLRRKIINDLVSDKSYESILDIGCGDGSLVLDFVNIADHISMIDLSENMLSLARSNISSTFPDSVTIIDYFNGDFISYKSDHQFDIILLVGVLAHVTDLEIVFKKLKNLLSDNGIIIIQYSDSNHFLIRLRHLWHRKNSKYVLNVIDKKLIDDLCAKNGFLIDAMRKFNFPFFGMSFFGDAVLFRFQYWLMKQNWLSFLLSDIMLVVSKKV